jgi:uncharacterized lipoprotein YehR (DUF1307 family)
MKKFIRILLALIIALSMVFSLCACDSDLFGGKDKDEQEDDYSAESGDGISYFAYDEEEAYLSFSWMNDGTAWISYMPATEEE